MSGVSYVVTSLKRRLNFSRKQRVVLIFGLFLVWQQLLNPTIANAILNFCLGGEVQGTNIVLSPNTMLSGIAIVAALVLLWILSKMGHRRIQSNDFHAADMPFAGFEEDDYHISAPALMVTVPAHANGALPVAINTNFSPSAYRLHRFTVLAALRLIQFVLDIRRAVSAMVKSISRWLGYVLSMAAHFIIEGVLWMLIGIIEGYRLLERAEVWLAKFVWRESLVFWTWFEPYAWVFDGWLEKQVHAGLQKTARSMHRNDFMAVVLAIGRHYAEAIKRYKY